MRGADKYYDLFEGESQQIGRLFLEFHDHARGKCFEMHLLPVGVKVKGDRIGATENSVKVYGMISGQRGWTEVYGWIHKGRWVDDFNKIVESRKLVNDKLKKDYNTQLKESAQAKADAIKSLLESY